MRTSAGPICRRVFSSCAAKSSTLLREARFDSRLSATGGDAASSPPLSSYMAVGTKFANRSLYAVSGLSVGMSGTFSIPGPDTAPTDCFIDEYDRHLVETSPQSVRVSQPTFL